MMAHTERDQSEAAPAETQYDFVVVSNRLPVDSTVADDGSVTWTTSPGGLVAALEPLMRESDGAWVGWPGSADLDLEPFVDNGIAMVPVALSADEFEEFYEGFSNDTLWPLYHDVISPPTYHRAWWETYVTVNERFAAAAAAAAAPGATVWVHDYQLQLVPQLLRSARPDLTIGFFLHIPFPPYSLFSQLPWRRQIIDGLLGADVIGFQRASDASTFRVAVDRLTDAKESADGITVPGTPSRKIVARPFPISIDLVGFEQLVNSPEVKERAAQIRSELGNPETILLGVDRLDYTKGIRHRIQAFGELLDGGEVDASEITLVQVANPSRERVAAYMQLRDEIEVAVGRINGSHGTLDHTPLSYLHQGFPRDEMAALYLAADIMLVTPLRDGMNLVAKEYVASRSDLDGVLILSEFAGAADELTKAVLVNPHDIDGLKEAIVRAIRMPRAERRTRMKALRRVVERNDVQHWCASFLTALEDAAEDRA